MKVILEKDLKDLGKRGDIVEVAEGYGRNYLLPRGLAVEATKGNVASLNVQKSAEKSKRERILKEARDLAARVDGQVLQIAAKVGENGKLFGSITFQEIAERLQKQYKVEIDKRKIDLAEPIKQLGTYPVTLKIHPKVQATVNVKVAES